MSKFKDKLFKRFKDYCDNSSNHALIHEYIKANEGCVDVIDINDSEGRVSIRKCYSDKFGMGASFFTGPSCGFLINESEFEELKTIYLSALKLKS